MKDPTVSRTVHIPDVQFGEGGGIPLFLDILRPDPLPAAPMPAVIYIHGGAWFEGARWPTWNVALDGCGFFTVSISYRLSQQATFPAQIEDCKAAVRWLRAHAERVSHRSGAHRRLGPFGGRASRRAARHERRCAGTRRR